MHRVLQQRLDRQMVGREIFAPVEAVFDQFDLVFAADFAHGGHVLVGGILGLAPKFLIPLPPVNGRHDDVGGGVLAQFDDEFLGVADGVDEHEIWLIRDDELPRPAAQVLPRAGVADHFAIFDGRRFGKTLGNFGGT